MLERSPSVLVAYASSNGVLPVYCKDDPLLGGLPIDVGLFET